MKGGVVMGLSEALKEELTFDQGRVTSTDWSSYKILTMAEMPEIQTVQISREDQPDPANTCLCNGAAQNRVRAL
jgi:nicotinate dehydrogenase subunit B